MPRLFGEHNKNYDIITKLYNIIKDDRRQLFTLATFKIDM